MRQRFTAADNIAFIRLLKSLTATQALACILWLLFFDRPDRDRIVTLVKGA